MIKKVLIYSGIFLFVLISLIVIVNADNHYQNFESSYFGYFEKYGDKTDLINLRLEPDCDSFDVDNIFSLYYDNGDDTYIRRGVIGFNFNITNISRWYVIDNVTINYYVQDESIEPKLYFIEYPINTSFSTPSDWYIDNYISYTYYGERITEGLTDDWDYSYLDYINFSYYENNFLIIGLLMYDDYFGSDLSDIE